MRKELLVSRDGQTVATLKFESRKTSLSYTRQFQDERGNGRPGLSCSLPVGAGPLDAAAWCRGLLPEQQHLARVAAEMRVSVDDTYALLRRLGRDIAGAYEVFDPTDLSAHRKPSLDLYTSETLSAEVARVADGSRPLAISDESELSVAGVQDKLLLVQTADGWARPLHGHLSTHIAKLDHPTHKGIVDAEAAALMLANAIDLSSVEAKIELFGNHRCIVVSRYDRETVDGATRRIHQEDFLQAMGLTPDARRGKQKYQDGGAGPPSLWHIAEVLCKYADENELVRLLAYVTFNILIGNGDAHARNYSVLIDDGGGVKLAPLYDTVPTQLWPGLRDRNALRVGDQSILSNTYFSDVVLEGQRWGLSAKIATNVSATVADRVRTAVLQVDHVELQNLILRNLERFVPEEAAYDVP